MKKFLIICGVVLLIIVVIMYVRNNRLEKVMSSPVVSAGTYERRVISDGDERRYLLYVPASYDWTAPQPLVLFFHGGGGGMFQAMEDYNWQQKADQEGFALAFMHGSSRRGGNLINTWNAGECCAYARDNNIDDVTYTRRVVSDIQSYLSIDQEKIFATGFSNGAMMTYRLACEASDLFAAIAPVSGTDNTISCNPANPISIIHIHARDDEAAKFDGGSGRQFESTADWVTDFRSVADTMEIWLVYNQLSDESERVFENPGASCDLYTSGMTSVAMQLCALETGGHTWPGGPAAGRRSGVVPSQALDATAVIWDFFVTYGRP
jgi:polyhydroxybutyrate depolymerase